LRTETTAARSRCWTRRSKARAQKDESIRTYFAAAGQTINGIRRTRSLSQLRNQPERCESAREANADLDRVRALLERVIAQAKEISTEAGRSYDALALQEDVLGIRCRSQETRTIARKWQTEYLTAREKMASSQIQVASLGRSPALDAVTNRIPNPFATKPAQPPETAPVRTRLATTPCAEPQLVSRSLSGRETKACTPLPRARTTTCGTVPRVCDSSRKREDLGDKL
jgi:hypothetical protein